MVAPLQLQVRKIPHLKIRNSSPRVHELQHNSNTAVTNKKSSTSHMHELHT